MKGEVLDPVQSFAGGRQWSGRRPSRYGGYGCLEEGSEVRRSLRRSAVVRRCRLISPTVFCRED